ncbi:hypothetical protein GC194_15705 [bacterium]|nr:hypothetical protein [bacterium]
MAIKTVLQKFVSQQNNTSLKPAITILLLLATVNQLFAGGPWATGKGNAFFEAGFTTKSWTGRFAGDYQNSVTQQLNRKVSESNWLFYAEYGISQKLSAVFNGSYNLVATGVELLPDAGKDYSNLLASGRLAAPGNPALTLKYQLGNGSVAWSVYGTYQPNFSSGIIEKGLQTDFNGSAFTGGLWLGQGLEKWYWQLSSGFCARSNHYAESVVGNAQIGYQLWRNAWLIADANYVVSMQNGTHIKSCYEQTGLYLDNKGYVACGAKLFAQIKGNFYGTLACYTGFGVTNSGNQLGAGYGGIAYKISAHDN